MTISTLVCVHLALYVLSLVGIMSIFLTSLDELNFGLFMVAMGIVGMIYIVSIINDERISLFVSLSYCVALILGFVIITFVERHKYN